MSAVAVPQHRISKYQETICTETGSFLWGGIAGSIKHNESGTSLSASLSVNATFHSFVQLNKYLLSIYYELSPVWGFVDSIIRQEKTCLYTRKCTQKALKVPNKHWWYTFQSPNIMPLIKLFLCVLYLYVSFDSWCDNILWSLVYFIKLHSRKRKPRFIPVRSWIMSPQKIDIEVVTLSTSEHDLIWK